MHLLQQNWIVELLKLVTILVMLLSRLLPCQTGMHVLLVLPQSLVHGLVITQGYYTTRVTPREILHSEAVDISINCLILRRRETWVINQW